MSCQRRKSYTLANDRGQNTACFVSQRKLLSRAQHCSICSSSFKADLKHMRQIMRLKMEGVDPQYGRGLLGVCSCCCGCPLFFCMPAFCLNDFEVKPLKALKPLILQFLIQFNRRRNLPILKYQHTKFPTQIKPFFPKFQRIYFSCSQVTSALSHG